jgi:hypothetical protein
MRDCQSLQEASVSVRCVARRTGLQPLIQVGWTVDDPSAQLAINRPISIEPHLRKRTFREPKQTRRFDCSNHLCSVRHIGPHHRIAGRCQQFQQCQDILIQVAVNIGWAITTKKLVAK